MMAAGRNDACGLGTLHRGVQLSESALVNGDPLLNERSYSSALAASRPLDFTAITYRPTERAAGTRLPRVDARQVRDMRLDGAAQLRRWGARDELVTDTEIVISELVANAFLHGSPGRDVILTLSSYESAIDVAVADGCPRLPRLPCASADSPDTHEDGRGLLLVRNATAYHGGTWRFTRWSTGKRINCTLPLLRISDHRERRARAYDAARINEATVYLGQLDLHDIDHFSWRQVRKVLWASLTTLAPFAERHFKALAREDPARPEIRAFLDWVRRLRAADRVRSADLLAAVPPLLDLAEAAVGQPA
ncbi:Histidine kinase-, DNA gyrase B-, and HSP90-like ATPase [Streptomyces rimosus subsp. rimosus]|uniref:Histidine kinase-, DNA gyrase B-, and HSP90-like ATPase n=1 Tax=Streptomyces rimosus subsp. rimosus TaxID=132474 RepID=A0ABY3YT34_STRRM|nr:Histidine kinase-, DNA gyrase B-, and HSP90-like ATPase [Streptomyces rimosus subsp. rimosus]UTH93074.1 Histidine kinase-, DNA gyrase B-, and HSP90-like ATPase [Streptomyces rimosus subsp. rimosus]UTJ11170.1 Histidine kinase-, DNA gyrase B-, and HSP90-like ATPase [Streptomyces rimosus subsp. rimosus]